MEVFTVKKEKYERAELEIIQFQTEDVITTSDPMEKFYEDDELQFVPNKP